ncbi:type II toxin-antitoxin system PemK/MazF family toxin [Deinococcus sedimenti]|uniref:mRNA interferase n=1 Tax=Deinococcus sedimenti TaxID=1867090 RepID=A0ABQ2S9K7_9DEIO|nr:type II toxin-antitoxin system PemK/MazF family toxin [Deinococcus sedimenti]GGS05488.1 mRNA interferase [Deinococcus sedimenti]
MRRGDLYLADLHPTRPGGAEPLGPVVIVSADSLNRTVERLGTGAVTVVPVSSKVSRVYDFQVLLSASDTGLGQDCKAQAEQLRTIRFEQLGQAPIGRLTATQVRQLDAALRLHLSL